MADIKQAAKWMQEGKRVRRPHNAHEISLGRQGDGQYFTDQVVVVFVHGKQRAGQECAPFSLEGLLADDWETAPTKEEPDGLD